MVDIQEIELDLARPTTQIVTAMQHDNLLRFVHIVCLSQGQFVPIEKELSPMFNCKLPNGDFYLDPTILERLEDGTLMLTLNTSILSASGKVEAEIDIYDGENKKVSTMPFQILVSPSVTDQTEIKESDDYNELDALIAKVVKDYSDVQLVKSYVESKVAEIEETVVLINQVKEDVIQLEASAEISANTSSAKATESGNFANLSKSYSVGGTGTRAGEDTDNSKYYYQKTYDIYSGLSGVLKPMGTVTFERLMTITDIKPGDMYNISNKFTSNERFKDGAGIEYGVGANVYYTADFYYDVLAPVSNDVIYSETEPIDQPDGGIWYKVIIEEV